jgi:ABC-type cobalamin/Fe3+-siderophores transport system ATPase subunit
VNQTQPGGGPPGRPAKPVEPLKPVEVLLEHVSFLYPEGDRLVFQDLSLELPRGIVTLVGQNGTGKSTLLLLASGILLPAEGRVLIQGVDSRQLREESERQRYVSFVYQNMEFETEEPIGQLLEYVHAHGYHERQDPALPAQLVEVFELGRILGKRTQEVSKGELQRTILAFSLLYGSRILMMDEPIFALEDRQKIRVMEFLTDYAHRRSLSLFYSVHELEISRKYSDYLLLFDRSGPPRLGPTAVLFSREEIERAYQVPYTMLKRKEALFRDVLLAANRRPEAK